MTNRKLIDPDYNVSLHVPFTVIDVLLVRTASFEEGACLSQRLGRAKKF